MEFLHGISSPFTDFHLLNIKNIIILREKILQEIEIVTGKERILCSSSEGKVIVLSL